MDADGEHVYQAQLTIKEKDTIVQASPTTKFSVAAMRLRAMFVDGTERDVDASSNITLRVEVTSPSSDYTLRWYCHPEGHPGKSCFEKPDAWSSFATSTYITNLMTRLHHMWHILHDVPQSSNALSRPPETDGIPHAEEDTEASPGHPANSTSGSDPSGEPYVKPSFLYTSWRYVETITLPATSLLATRNKFVFEVVCAYGSKSSEDKQLIVVSAPRDSIGIVSLTRSQFPYGAVRRMVFESKCQSCSPQDLAALQYSWDLKFIFEGLSYATRDISLGMSGKPNLRELKLQTVLRRGRLAEGFLPRPRDYLRVYKKSALESWFERGDETEEEQEEEEGSGGVAPPYPEAVSARDLRNLPGPVTDDIIARASEIHLRWSSSPGQPRRARGRSGPSRQKRSVRRDTGSPSSPAPHEKKGSRPSSLPLSSLLLGQGYSRWPRGQDSNHPVRGHASPLQTNHRRGAQTRQMRGEDRTSSGPANKRRVVPGRRSGWKHGGGEATMMDEAGSQEHTRVTSAKVTHHRQQHHLLHEAAEANILSVQYGELGSEEGGPRQDARGEGETWTSVGSKQEPHLDLMREAEHSGHHPIEAASLIPVHRYVERADGVSKGQLVVEDAYPGLPDVGDEDMRVAYIQGERRSKDRSSEGENCTNEEKVREDNFQRDERLLRWSKDNDDDWMKIHEEAEDEDAEILAEDPAGGVRTGHINERDRGGRVHQFIGGSKRRKKWRQMTLSNASQSKGAHDTSGATKEHPGEHKNLANTQSQVSERGCPGCDKKSQRVPGQKTTGQEVAEVTSQATAAADILLVATEEESKSSPEDAKTEGTTSFTEVDDRFADAPRNPVMHLKTPPDAPQDWPPIGLTDLKEELGSAHSTSLPRSQEDPTDAYEREFPPSSPSQFPATPLPSPTVPHSTTHFQGEEEEEFSTVGSNHLDEDKKSEASAHLQSTPGSVEEEVYQQVDKEISEGKTVLGVPDITALDSRTTDVRKEGEHGLETVVGVEEDTAVRAVQKNVLEVEDGEQQAESGGAVGTSSHDDAEEEAGDKENDLTSGANVKVGENDEHDAHDGANDASSLMEEAGKVSPTSLQPAHQHSDSSRLPIRAAHSSPVPDGRSPVGRLDQVVHDGALGAPRDARERKPSTHRARAAKSKYSIAELSHDRTEFVPAPIYTPLSVLRGSSPDNTYAPPKATDRSLTPSTPGEVLDSESYKRPNADQVSRRNIAPHAAPKPNVSPGNTPRKVGRREGDRRRPAQANSDRKASIHKSEIAGGRSRSASRSLERKNRGSSHLGGGSRAYGRGQGRASARISPLITEGSPPPVRDLNYQKHILQYAKKYEDVPNWSCRAESWEQCRRNPPNAQANATLIDTLGDPGQEEGIKRDDEDDYDPFVTEKAQLDVILFQQMTSTGTHGPVLVLYTDLLYTGIRYVLHLNTYNLLTNTTGQAKQLIKFSPPPTLKNCRVRPLQGRKGLWYRASCDEVHGNYYPVLLQWSYRFLRLGTKTVFYHGARTSFDFTLPSGLESNGYMVYVSVKAIDGKGVSYKYPNSIDLEIHPRSSSGDGILSIFQEISNLENESPSLLLQQVRSLAWELNLVLSSDITQTVFDNILAIIFYRTSCKDILETVNDPSSNNRHSSFIFGEMENMNFFVEINLLKSCARDHMTEIVVELPVRDEMEVLQILTALQIIIDAPEYISSMTYSRVITAMHTAADRMWFGYNAEVRTEAAQEYFVLSSAVLDKQAEIYDWNTTSIHLSNTVIKLLLNVMETETRARFLEEEPLAWSTDTLTFRGYLAEAENINRCNHSVSFLFEPHTVPHGVHLVQSLVHWQSPYNITEDPITSGVVNVDLRVSRDILLQVKVKVKRSKIRMGPGYDFRRRGVLTPQSLSVYEFTVTDEHRTLTFHVLLQITRVLNSEYPVAAVVLICRNMQSLKDPLYKQELMATVEASEVSLFLPPGTLSLGKKLLIIIDKNSYENNWGRYNTSSEIRGADFLVSAWWSQCLVWDNSKWNNQSCSVISEESSWDLTTCSCKSKFSVYGAQSIPILDEESKMDVNELMLHKTYLALYFMMLLLVVYFILALAMQTSDRHRLRRRNIWLRDNKPEHEWAYLLTIKTGTQWNAGTTSRVYVILHGTHGMSETRELQSKQTGQLFTRGALCTFILTTPEPLGDILKVQVWHDNSGGSESGWYVCETSVADLVLGARYAYPCYRWLSVQAEDAKVEREITLESPTTFLQDFEHFLPQYASEHMLWTSLLTTSNTTKLYRLQRLTICLIVCLCLGTVSLAVVQRMNNEHTMMVPDMHIQSLFYGGVIALLLLPVQWLLEMVFKMSNRLEEKEYNAKAVLDTLRATKEMGTAALATDEPSNEQENFADSEVFDPNARIWRDLTRWAQSAELSRVNRDLIHPALLCDQDSMHVTQRMRSSSDDKSSNPPPQSTLRGNSFEPLPTAAFQNNLSSIINDNPEATSTKKCSPTILHFLSELRKTFTYMLQFLSKNKKLKNKKRTKMEEEGCNSNEEDDDDDDDVESDDLGCTSSFSFILSQCVGWMVCCFFAAMCCMALFVQGSGMPMDYGALWIHIIYVTLCFSLFVMQPLVVVIYTLYKVCMYRWLGCRGCISSCVTVPLDQVVAIWNRYQTVLLGRACTAEDTNSEKLLEDRQRTRDLRFAHPPSEDYLLKCRETEVRREKVSGLLCNTLGHLLLLILLAIIACNANIEECFTLNRTIYSALENGTCLDSARYLDTCTSSGTNRDSCNQEKDEDYMRFRDVKTKDDWWKWAYSELLAFTYNYDKKYSLYKIFCDSNSIIIGTPRLRKYDIDSQECEASKYKISNNKSLADLLRVKTCFPDYVDKVSHLFGFDSNMNKEYEWDAHFLAVTYGKYSQYSYTHHKQSLANTRFGTILRFLVLQGSNWLSENSTRAVVTEFTLYHPQTNLYTTVNLLAEFPSLSGAEVKAYVKSSHIERYKGRWAYVCMLAEILLLTVSMYYLNRSTIYIYICRVRVWKSFWGILDILMTLMSWTFMVCLMLRVQIAEDAMWQLRVAYFQKFINLKGLTTWDNTLETLIGGMLMVHVLRCLRLTRYLPRLQRLGLVMASAAQDVCIISILVTVWLICCMLLGYMWFGAVLSDFHTLLETTMTLFKIIMARLPFVPNIENESSGYIVCLGYFYYIVTYILLYQVTRALYVAAFMYARKSFVHKPGVNVNWRDISFYMKERYQSVLQKLLKKKKDEIQPKDNTPPDFYVAELELQISQVMGKLENLAETLGLVLERMDELEEDQTSVSDISDSATHPTGAKGLMCSYDCLWYPEEKIKSSLKTELQEALRPLQHSTQDLKEAEHNRHLLPNQVRSSEGSTVNEKQRDENSHNIPVETSFNLDAFTDIASCQTVIEALARNWNLNMTTLDPSTKLGAHDDGGRLAKFLKDVSAASEESVTSFGKYGKTVGKLKLSSKLHPSYESLAAVQNHHGDASETLGLHSVKSPVITPQYTFGLQTQIHTFPSGQTDSPTQGPVGISSRLCRTQTQGRGKGHVDFLDIVSLDSEDDSEC